MRMYRTVREGYEGRLGEMERETDGGERMTKPHAFQKRDFFPCAECFYFRPKEGKPYCERNSRPIHYNPKEYGCGEFGVGEEKKTYDTTLGMFL